MGFNSGFKGLMIQKPESIKITKFKVKKKLAGGSNKSTNLIFMDPCIVVILSRNTNKM